MHESAVPPDRSYQSVTSRSGVSHLLAGLALQVLGIDLAMGRVWRLFLATPEAVPAARHALAELDGVDSSTRSVLELLTSELVTNAIRHGARDPNESILFSASKTNGAVRVEVCDEGDGFDAPPEQGDLLEPGGHGLLLVDTLAERWGVSRGNPNCVWFEQTAQAA